MERLGPRGGAAHGAAGPLSLGLIVGFLLLGFAALRVLELAPRSSPRVQSESEPVRASAEPAALSARVVLGDAPILARLLPLHDERVLEEFRAGALRERYGLPDGEPWRLYLSLDEPSEESSAEDSAELQAAGAEVRIRGARVGASLLPFAALARAPEGPDPVYALLAAPPGPLEREHARPWVLWGSSPGPGEALELSTAEGSASGLLQSDEAAADVPRWYAGTNPPPRAGRSLVEEVARLQRELERERARRAEREQAFSEFTRILGTLPVGKQLGLEPAAVEPPPPSAEELARREAEAAARVRAEELGRSLSVLMRLEGLRGLDLLDPGTLQAGPPSAIGPVVLRCLDERGLLTGSMRAERLRCEASLAARTLTLVLEDGSESHGGERVPFEGGARRITLREVDPEPWLEECPELFDAADVVRAEDDGRWSLAAVRRELNRVLGLDTRMGWYRLHSLGGVRGRALLDVQLEELDPSGRIERRIFADSLVLTLEDESLVLDFQDGAFVRGGEKQPFRDGHHRLVLPGARSADGRSTLLPGLAEPPERENAAEAAPSGG